MIVVKDGDKFIFLEMEMVVVEYGKVEVLL